jgi:hypothetical protein
VRNYSKRRIVPLLTALMVPLLFAVPSASAHGGVPVLGSHAALAYGAGFGTVEPRTVYLGGDPTGQVSSITWHNWGSGRAVGFGRGWCPGSSVASGHSCLAAVHVYGLGSYHGRPAHRALAFYFKQGPTWFLGSKWDACTGQYQP